MAVFAILATLLSGLYGVVSRAPTKPVCQVSMPCSAPYAHTTVVFSRAGVSRKVTTDADGRYRVALTPGRWSLHVPASRFGWRPTAATVPSGRYARLNVVVDTGIR